MEEIKKEEAKVEEQPKEVDIRDLGIDKEVLEKILGEDVLKTIDDPKLLNRAILNYFAENFALLNKIAESLEKLQRLFTILGQEKLLDYFGTLKNNFVKEEKRQITMTKVHKDHQKSKENK